MGCSASFFAAVYPQFCSTSAHVAGARQSGTPIIRRLRNRWFSRPRSWTPASVDSRRIKISRAYRFPRRPLNSHGFSLVTAGAAPGCTGSVCRWRRRISRTAPGCCAPCQFQLFSARVAAAVQTRHYRGFSATATVLAHWRPVRGEINFDLRLSVLIFGNQTPPHLCNSLKHQPRIFGFRK